jgi:hypothetical protein
MFVGVKWEGEGFPSQFSLLLTGHSLGRCSRLGCVGDVCLLRNIWEGTGDVVER